MTDLGFTEVITPQERVREFYRRQGEARLLKEVLTKLAQMEEMRLRYGLDIGFDDAQEVILALVDIRVAQTTEKEMK